MKKVFTILFFVTAFIFNSNAQQWVSFSRNEPSVPNLNLLTSNTQTVSFDLTIPGIYKLDTLANSSAFTRLILPGSVTINSAGAPEIPVLLYNIAIPECSGVNITYNIISQQNMPSCLLYPVPQMVVEVNPDGFEEAVEQFTFDPTAYALPRSGNEPVAAIYSSGTFRAQRYVEVMICPVVYCPVTQQLSVIDEIEITLTFINPKGVLRQNVGIFNKVATNAFINYEDDGISAAINDKAFEKTGFTQGNVQYKKINTPTDVLNITADYLIICANAFYPSGGIPHSEVLRLANHRAFYNGFDVMILNVEDILSDAVGFYYEEQDSVPPHLHKKEQRMRTCIRTIYETGIAHHTGDGKLGYVLLIGDCLANNTGMPTSYDHDVTGPNPDIVPSDYYFSCITKDETGIYDDIADLLIGRFSVENTTHLYNMVEKTIYFETEYSPTTWRKSTGFTNGTWFLQSHTIAYFNFINSFLQNTEWNSFFVDHYNIPGSFDQTTLNYMNEGVTFCQYVGHGNITLWEKNIDITNLTTGLHNDYKPMFISTQSCSTGQFDNAYCIAEFFTRYSPTKGAVGYVGASRITMGNPSNQIDTLNLFYWECYPYYLFSHNISIAGELVLTAKMNHRGESILWLQAEVRHLYKYINNLFGDPALNIMAKGYEITRNVTTDCSAEISCNVRVHNGATLTIPHSCNLNILAEGKLTIEADGSLNIANGAQINGYFASRDSSIHVKGGGFTVGSDVTFNYLKGILLENNKNSQGLPLYDDTKQYNITNAIFNSTPLTHSGSMLNIANCTFNTGSHVNTSTSSSNIDNCTFNQTTFNTSFANKTSTLQDVTVSNSHFISNQNENEAIQINNARILEVFNNTITGYETGINLTSSGATTAYYEGCKTVSAIHHNEISNCYTGIELYNSIVNIASNNIHDNEFGVRLFNNSSTSFGRLDIPTVVPQIISDNESYELYASSRSFPIIFRFNKIFDVNLGNSFDDPMIYWDLENLDRFPSSMLRDVKYNCWGYTFDPLEDFYPSKYYIYNPLWQCGKSVIATFDTVEILYQLGLDYVAELDFINAKTVFKNIIENHSQSSFAIAAMNELFSLQHFSSNGFYELHDYLTSISPSDSNLFDVADFLATRCNVWIQNWQPAIDWYENRIENPPSYPDSVFAVIDLGDIHLMMEVDSGANGAKSSASCHYRLAEVKPKSKQEYETNKANLLATLPQIKNTQTDQPKMATKDKKGVLGQNIPNPANGTTTIKYEIYTESNIEIRIYNITGQLIKKLQLGIHQQGNYQIVVPLENITNGIYNYTLFINGEKTDTKKMVIN